MIKNKLLLAVVVIAAFLRLWSLSEVPPHLTNDEAALGYNAYSILKTGRDEHGTLLPIVFKSFGDWKPGLYVYTSTPFVALFGLNELSVRLPSALAGVLAVLLLYLLVLHMLKSRGLAIFSAFMLSINPWHLQFSRGAWEANLALTIVLIAIYLFVTSMSNRSPKRLLFSALFFALSLWSYQSAKLASLLVILLLSITYREELLSFKKSKLLMAMLIGILFSLPIVMTLFNGKSGRIEVISVFSYHRSDEYIDNTILSQDGSSVHSLSFLLFHSEPYNLAKGVLGRYFNHFSGKFLFVDGDWTNPRHSPPYTGYFYLVLAPLLVAGAVACMRAIDSTPVKFFVLWMLASPIPSALTKDSVHGVRSLNMVIPIIVIISIGGVFLWEKIKLLFIRRHRALIALLATVFFVALFVNTVYYFDSYYIHLPFMYSKHYQYGYKQAVKNIIGSEDKYSSIEFAQSYDQPYIFFLFYGAGSGVGVYEPENFQKNNSFKDISMGDVGQIERIGRVKFRGLNWPTDRDIHGALVVGTQHDFPLPEIIDSELYDIKTIKYLNGDTAFAQIFIK